MGCREGPGSIVKRRWRSAVGVLVRPGDIADRHPSWSAVITRVRASGPIAAGVLVVGKGLEVDQVAPGRACLEGRNVVVCGIGRLVHDRGGAAGCPAVVGSDGLAGNPAVGVVCIDRRAVRRGGIGTAVERRVVDLRRLDVTHADGVAGIQLADQVAVPVAVPRRGRSGHTGRWTRQCVLCLCLPQQRGAVGVVEIGLVLVPVPGVPDLPPGIVVAGVETVATGARTGELAAVVNAKANRGIELVNLDGAVRFCQRGLGEPRELAVVIVEVITIFLIAPVKALRAARAGLSRKRRELIGIRRRGRDRRVRLRATLPVLAGTDHGSAFLGEHDMAPVLVIGLIAGELALSRAGQWVEVAALVNPPRVVSGVRPTECLLEAEPIAHGSQVIAVALVALTPEWATATGSRIPARSACR